MIRDFEERKAVIPDDEKKTAVVDADLGFRYVDTTASILHHKGLVLNECGKHDEAKNLFSSALELDPQLIECHNDLGEACRKLARWDEALQHYDTAIAKQPSFAKAYSNKALTLIEGFCRYQEAISLYNKALTINPGLMLTKYNLIVAEFIAGDIALANKLANAFIKEYSDLSESNEIKQIMDLLGEVDGETLRKRRALLLGRCADTPGLLAPISDPGSTALIAGLVELAIRKLGDSPAAAVVRETLSPDIYDKAINLIYEKFEQTRKDGTEHSGALYIPTKHHGTVCLVFCSIPSKREDARKWFDNKHGGFLEVISRLLNYDKLPFPDYVLHFTIGFDSPDSPWVMMALVPKELDDVRPVVLPYELIPDELRKGIGNQPGA